MDATAYLDLILKLLPKGKAWRVTPQTTLGKLLTAFADGAARFDARLLQLLEETDPRTTLELVDAWERCVGLPDGCTGGLTDIDERRAAIWQRLTSTGGQSKAYFIEIAERLGYAVAITGFRTCQLGDRLGVRLFTTPWRFTWQVTVTSAEPAPVLECVFNRLKPAESAIIFIYEA